MGSLVVCLYRGLKNTGIGTYLAWATPVHGPFESGFRGPQTAERSRDGSIPSKPVEQE